MDATLPAQPAGYRQLMKQSFVLYRAGFLKSIGLGFLLSVAVFIPRLHAYFIGANIFSSLTPFSLQALWLIVVNLISILFFIGLIWHMHCVNRHIHEPFIEDLVVGMKKLFYVLVATLIQSIIIYAIALTLFGVIILLHNHQLLFPTFSFGAFIPVLIFGLQFILIIYLWTLFLFLIPLIAIENKGILTSLERSAALVWNHWWRIFSVQFTPWVCYIVLLVLIKFFFHIDIHIYFTPHDYASIWPTVLNIVLFGFFTPWLAALLVVQLKDLELRKRLLNAQ